MDVDFVTRAFTLPVSTLAKLEWLASKRNSPLDNTLAAAIAEAAEQWQKRWPLTYANKGSTDGL